MASPLRRMVLEQAARKVRFLFTVCICGDIA